jgi:hypothetical protein
MRLFSITAFLIMFFANTASSMSIKKDFKAQYNEVINYLCSYVHDYFKEATEIRIFKETYLPKKIKKVCKKSGIKIRYVSVEDVKDEGLEGVYVLRILEMRPDSNLYRIGVVCHKLGMEQDRVILSHTSSITYWFKEVDGDVVYLKSNGGLPVDFK